MIETPQKLRPEDIAVRILDKHAEVIEAALISRYPDIHVSRDPLPDEAALRVLISFRPPADEDLSHYDWIHSTGAGVDAILDGLADVAERPIITRTIGRMGSQIAEYCLAYALGFFQKTRLRQSFASARVWEKEQTAPEFLFNSEVSVIGTGEIGAAIGSAFQKLDAKVIGYSKSGQAVRGFDEVRTLAEKSFASAGVVVMALPATAATENLVSDDMLRQLQGALLINIGRGSTLDHAALERALAAGHVAHAVLDVFEEEPLPATDWRWTHPDITVTPHVAGLTLPDDAVNRFCQLLEDFLDEGKVPATVDPVRGY